MVLTSRSVQRSPISSSRHPRRRQTSPAGRVSRVWIGSAPRADPSASPKTGRTPSNATVARTPDSSAARFCRRCCSARRPSSMPDTAPVSGTPCCSAARQHAASDASPSRPGSRAAAASRSGSSRSGSGRLNASARSRSSGRHQTASAKAALGWRPACSSPRSAAHSSTTAVRCDASADRARACMRRERSRKAPSNARAMGTAERVASEQSAPSTSAATRNGAAGRRSAKRFGVMSQPSPRQCERAQRSRTPEPGLGRSREA